MTLIEIGDSMEEYEIISPAEYVSTLKTRQEEYSDEVVKAVLKSVSSTLQQKGHSYMSANEVSFMITVWKSAGKSEEIEANGILVPKGWEAELISNSRSMSDPKSTWRIVGKVAEQA